MMSQVHLAPLRDRAVGPLSSSFARKRRLLDSLVQTSARDLPTLAVRSSLGTARAIALLGRCLPFARERRLLDSLVQTFVNGQVVIPVGGQLKVPTLRVFLSGC